MSRVRVFMGTDLYLIFLISMHRSPYIHCLYGTGFGWQSSHSKYFQRLAFVISFDYYFLQRRESMLLSSRRPELPFQRVTLATSLSDAAPAGHDADSLQYLRCCRLSGCKSAFPFSCRTHFLPRDGTSFGLQHQLYFAAVRVSLAI